MHALARPHTQMCILSVRGVMHPARAWGKVVINIFLSLKRMQYQRLSYQT